MPPFSSRKPRIQSTAIVIGVLLVASSCIAAMPSTRPAWEKPRSPKDRLICWFVIGWSDDNPPMRNIGWNLPQRGWETFVTMKVIPQLRWGARRILLHNPFGAIGEEDMQFSQLQQAQRTPGLEKITDIDAFVRAWKPITASGVEVIAYLGSPTKADRLYGDPALQDSRQTIRVNAIAPFLAAGMSIALDAASGQDRHSDTYALASELRKKGIRVYIEALAPRSATWWHDYPAMATPWFYYHADRPKWDVVESNDETMILRADAAPGKTWEQAVREDMGDDRSVAIGATQIDFWRMRQVRIEQVLGLPRPWQGDSSTRSTEKISPCTYGVETPVNHWWNVSEVAGVRRSGFGARVAGQRFKPAVRYRTFSIQRMGVSGIVSSRQEAAGAWLLPLMT